MTVSPTACWTGMDSPVRADWSRTAESFRDRPVDRDHIALADDEAIARLDRLQCHLFQPAVPVAQGTARLAGEQRRHLAACAALGKALEILPAGIHHRDHDGGEVFGKHQGRQHRKCGDDVQAHIAAAQADDDLDQEDNQNRNGSHGPYQTVPMLPAGQLYCEAEEETRRRPYDHDRRQQRPRVGQGISTGRNGFKPSEHVFRAPEWTSDKEQKRGHLHG